MSIGPGKYDELLTQAREAAGATGAILIVFDGVHGPGWSTQCPIPMLLGVPTVLREMADNLERSMERGEL